MIAPTRCRLPAALPALALTLALGPALAAEAVLHGRLTHARPAPWTAASAPAPAMAWADATLRLQGGRLQGPAPLHCDRARGQALLLPAAPAGVVQRLLERHVMASPRFTTATLDDLQPFTSAGLQLAARNWLAQAGQADEVPAINGDPFTDSQEPVLHFVVGLATQRGNRAVVPVQMVDEGRRWMLHYRLRHGAEGWRVDDVWLRDGASLRQLLEARP